MRPYLAADGIVNVQLDFEYKKKSMGGSIIFKKTQFHHNNKSYVIELAGKNGCWSILPEELDRVFHQLNIVFSFPHQNVSSPAALHEMKIRLLVQKTGWNGIAVNLFPVSVVFPEWKKHLTREKYLELYSNYADPAELHYFDADSPEYGRIQRVLDEVASNQRVLGIGCNSGYVGEALLQKDCEVFGIDINPMLVNKAMQKGIYATTGWAEALPYSSASFDNVVVCYLLEHVLDPGKVLMEAHRVLKENGKMIGSVPTEYGDWGAQNVPIHSEHLRFYTQSSLGEALQQAGFTHIQIRLEVFSGREVADSYFFTCQKRGQSHAIH